MSESLDASAAARALFSNSGLHENAAFIAKIDPCALDYLQQAPVLALAFGAKFNTSADRLYVAMRIGGPISRGERLRAVMSAVGVAFPLRKLRGGALDPQAQGIIRLLSGMDHSTLAQIIPETVGKQRVWLRTIAAYLRRVKLRGRRIEREEFAWLASRCAGALSSGTRREAEDVADYIHANGALNWKRWTWERAQIEVELWHDRLASERKLPAGFRADTVIDLSDWPDHYQAGELEFFKLATPGMLMQEGSRMRHCVASYVPDVINGKCSIYSVRSGMRRVATMQIADIRIRQLAGFANKPVTKSVRAACEAFVRTLCETQQ